MLSLVIRYAQFFFKNVSSSCFKLSTDNKFYNILQEMVELKIFFARRGSYRINSSPILRRTSICYKSSLLPSLGPTSRESNLIELRTNRRNLCLRSVRFFVQKYISRSHFSNVSGYLFIK